jgi:hypothetical protein
MEVTLSDIEVMYSDMRAREDLIRLERDQKIIDLIGIEAYRTMQLLNEECELSIKDLRTECQAIEDKMRALVLQQGSSFTGTAWQVQYVKTKIEIKDLPGLLMYSKDHPEVLNFIEEKPASTRIVAARKK